VTPYNAVLLIAFGGPEKFEDVRPFLANVLRGRPVPPERIETVVEQYRAIGGKSPLNEITVRQALALAGQLAECRLPLPVYIGMRNWTPYLSETLHRMREDGVYRALAIVMAPHRSPASWEKYREAAEAADDAEVAHQQRAEADASGERGEEARHQEAAKEPRAGGARGELHARHEEEILEPRDAEDDEEGVVEHVDGRAESGHEPHGDHSGGEREAGEPKAGRPGAEEGPQRQHQHLLGALARDNVLNLLAVVVPLLATGRMGDRFGLRRMFLAGVVVFTVFATASAMAPSFSLLLLARFLQGLGAAMLLPVRTVSAGGAAWVARTPPIAAP
jgi:hypothetical protein